MIGIHIEYEDIIVEGEWSQNVGGDYFCRKEGSGFIRFANSETMEKALAMDGNLLLRRKISVKISTAEEVDDLPSFY